MPNFYSILLLINGPIKQSSKNPPLNVLYLKLLGILTLVFLSIFILFWLSKMLRSINKVRKQQRGQFDLLLNTFQGTLEEIRSKGDQLKQLNLEAIEKIETVENYNENILQSMNSGVLTFNTEGKVTTFNEAARKIFRIKENDLKYGLGEKLFDNHKEIAQLWEDAIINNKLYDRKEFQLSFSKGEYSWIGVRSSLLKNQRGKIIGTSFLISDLTDVKRLEKAMKTRERLAALGEMSAGIAHEFRNSLGAIHGYAKLIKKKAVKEPNIIGFSQEIITEINKLDEIMKKFLNYVRPLKLNCRLYDLNKLIEESLFHVKKELHQKKIDITLELQEDLPKINIDNLLIRQTLINIIQNAIQASRKNDSIVIKSIELNEFQRIEILDNGSGIPSDIKDKIFTPFFTTKAMGTGLGLSITQKIVADHGGSIEVDSVKGNGTIFKIYLPKKMAL